MKVKKVDFNKAKRITDSYRKQVYDKLVDPNKGYTCICCKENSIIPILGDSGIKDVLKQEEEMWSGGTVMLVSFGYASKLDMEAFYMAICDDCTIRLGDEKLIVNYHHLFALKKLHGL